ncbi:MAG: hypothetical protein RMZ43_036010, partial [Nostoc sp. CmiVER01]|uniref:hypothetical protein n=1 Tax=Nostoc sp. CmiVER01 TaxID=3075384 RepID=UPI003D160B24
GLAMGEIEDFYSHATPIAMNNRPIQTPAKRGDVWMLELDPKNASGYRMRNVDLDTIRIPDGKYDYVIPFRHPDRIALMPTRTGGRGFGMGHTSMTQTTPGHADDVLYAGDISFDRGTLTQWSNQSGHYLPDTDLIDSNLTPTVKQLLPMSKFTARE